MKVKCYGLFEGDKEMILIFANPSQRDFLDYQLKNALKRLKKTTKIEFENTANGVWYIRQHPSNKMWTQLMLVSKQAASMSIAASFFNQSAQIEANYELPREKDKLRMKVIDLIKIFNANDKVDKLSSNVMELEDIIKGNVNKLVTNMSELDTAQRKSEAMAELSLQFQRDSKELEKKMKRRQCMMRMIVIGLVSLVLGIVIFILFA